MLTVTVRGAWLCSVLLCDRLQGQRTFLFFFFKDPAPPGISPLPLPAALPIGAAAGRGAESPPWPRPLRGARVRRSPHASIRAPARTPRARRGRCGSAGPGRVRSRARRGEIGRAPSELQSQSNLVCRLLLEKKKTAQPLAALRAQYAALTARSPDMRRSTPAHHPRNARATNSVSFERSLRRKQSRRSSPSTYYSLLESAWMILDRQVDHDSFWIILLFVKELILHEVGNLMT